MNKHLAAFRDSLERTKAMAAAEASPLRRKILENYIRHAAMECGYPNPRWMDIFSDEMMADHVCYNVQMPGDKAPTRIEGEAAVQNLYRGLLSVGMHTTEVIKMAVADWGFAIHEIGSMYVSAAQAADLGYVIDNPNPMSTYRIDVRLANYWRFDETGRLQGEDINLLDGHEIQELPPEEVFTFEELLEVIGPYMGPRPAGLHTVVEAAA